MADIIKVIIKVMSNGLTAPSDLMLEGCKRGPRGGRSRHVLDRAVLARKRLAGGLLEEVAHNDEQGPLQVEPLEDLHEPPLLEFMLERIPKFAKLVVNLFVAESSIPQGGQTSPGLFDLAILQLLPRAFVYEPDEGDDDRGHNIKESQGDAPGTIVGKRACATANGVDDQAAHDEAELICADDEASDRTGHDLGLVCRNYSKFHAHIDIFSRLGQTSYMMLDSQFRIRAAMTWSLCIEVTAMVAVTSA